MSINFYGVNSTEICGFCRETMENCNAISHDNIKGNRQVSCTWHRECIIEWMISKQDFFTCPDPICKTPLNHSLSFTWQERAIIHLNCIKNDIVKAHSDVEAAAGAIGGILGTAAVVTAGTTGVAVVIGGGVIVASSVAMTTFLIDSTEVAMGRTGVITFLAGVAGVATGAAVTEVAKALGKTALEAALNEVVKVGGIPGVIAATAAATVAIPIIGAVGGISASVMYKFQRRNF